MNTNDTTEDRVTMLRELLDMAAQKVGEQRQTIKELRGVLSQMLDLVEFSEMSNRDMEPHEFEAVRECVERTARAAIARSEGTKQ
jgi:uncharacterized membrane protein